MKTWSKIQIQNHILAAKKLGLIKDEVALFIKSNKNIYEKDVVDLIKRSYKKHELINDSKKEFGIVAFGKNTKEVHYFPSSTSNSKLKTNNLILLDIWARLDKPNAPYADMTWMFYFSPRSGQGEIPDEIQNKWKILSQARDEAIGYIEKEIAQNKLPANHGLSHQAMTGWPRGLDIDRISHDVIGKAGFGESIQHTIGHSLGFKSPHGDLPGINWREYSPILKNVGYTIEPGMYFEKYGMRTEIDFYITEQNKVVITTPIQTEIDTIKI
ncbi:MAG: M24 family metallopeptidase [Candidatus Paceibacterota bacterium]